jgi:signal transduction histidine kinase/ActR/RegA family two-component response regulator
MLKSFRARVFGAFLLMVALVTILLAINRQFLNRWGSLQHVSDLVYESRAHFVAADNALNTFLTEGVRDTSFYKSQKHPALEVFNAQLDSVAKTFDQVRKADEEAASILDEIIPRAEYLSQELEVAVDSLQGSLYERGFWDYGIEGEMRNYAHLIEDERLIPLNELLSLRRREKDYQLRSDRRYVDSLVQRVDALLTSIDPADARARSSLNGYKTAFLSLVTIDEAVGLNSAGGLTADIRSMQASIDAMTKEMVQRYNLRRDEVNDDLFNFWLLTGVSLFVLSIVLSYLLTRFLSRDIREISLALERFRKSDFNDFSITLRPSDDRDEISRLKSDVIEMKKRLEKLVNGLREERNKANEAAETKTRFLANMSHEIRTPLNGVIGMIDLFEETDLDDQQAEYLRIIQYSAQSLLSVISDVLDYSKIEADAVIIDQHPFDLQQELDSLYKMLRTEALKKDLDFQVTISAAVPTFVKGDVLRIRQVLINLLNNAIKFTEKGSVELIVTIDSQGRHCFSINDTGIGIKPEALRTLFDPFVQADTSTTRQYGGTGLGLSIAKDLTERMHGELKVESTFGEGSVFRVHLPLEMDETQKNRKKVSRTIADQRPLQILLAEDNEINQTVIRMMLEKTGAHVTVAANGAEAVMASKQNVFDLVLMDLQMPELDGYEAFQRIRQFEQMATKPVVALTANATEEERQRVLQAGMDGFLTKPLQKDALDRLLAEIKSNGYNEKPLV